MRLDLKECRARAKMYYRRLWFAWRLLRSLALFLAEERRRGALVANLRSIAKSRSLELARDMSHAELLGEKADEHGEKPFLYFKDCVLSFKDMDENANRVANFLRKRGGRPGVGLAIVMKNSPRWLDVFFGLEKVGMYAVPVNVALRGDQLSHVLENSEARMVVIDHDLVEPYRSACGGLERVRKVIVNTEGAPDNFTLPEGAEDLAAAYDGGSDASRPPFEFRPDDLCVLMYTSGTTGLPKGVVYRYNTTKVKPISIIGRIILNGDDVAYTCYPLFHANALFLTVTPALHAGCRVALAERFSASRFWDDIRRYGVTTFNGLGSVIPILMKQPVRPDDRHNRVRAVLSAGCPADIWEEFEQRFGIEIFEGYGAVDGGGVVITNFGNAPVGSMGKPLGGAKYRVIDPQGRDVPPGTPGELICYVGEGGGSVEYYRNPDATNEKVKDGWLYTGDLVYSDEKGYLYFVGRNTESMRVGGENVSAYEVEAAVLKHPDVLECAVYAVPSELAEDEIMVTLVPVEGRSVEPAELVRFLSERLARFAVPRYIRVVDSLPKTETHRVIKKELERLGVTDDTYDRKAGDRRR